MVKKLTSLAASKKLKFFNGDEFIEGTGIVKSGFTMTGSNLVRMRTGVVA